jgi:tetratricopeptide (TPR) repeat protein
VAGDIVRADRSQAARSNSLFQQRAAQGDAGAAIARASVMEATGNVEEARAALGTVTSGPLAAVAQMKLGAIALNAGRDADAIAGYERALYRDADGAITDAIAFRAPGPRAQLIALYSRTGRDLAAIRLAEGDSAGQQSLISTAVRNALTSGSSPDAEAATVSFEPSFDVARSKGASLMTIAEMNNAAESKIKIGLLSSLVESASKLGQYDRAIALERLRASEATRPEEKTAIEKRLAEMIAAERARQQRLASLLRVDQSNTTQSIYAARVIGR